MLPSTTDMVNDSSLQAWHDMPWNGMRKDCIACYLVIQRAPAAACFYVDLHAGMQAHTFTLVRHNGTVPGFLLTNGTGLVMNCSLNRVTQWRDMFTRFMHCWCILMRWCWCCAAVSFRGHVAPLRAIALARVSGYTGHLVC